MPTARRRGCYELIAAINQSLWRLVINKQISRTDYDDIQERLVSSQDDKRTIFRLAVPVALKTAAGLPLSGCVRIQHSGTLHPWPDSVHPGTDGLLFHTTPAPLNAVLNPEHENRLLSPSQSALASFDRSVKKRQGEVYGWAGVTAFVSISASSLKQKIERRAKRNARCQHPGLGTPCNKQTTKKLQD